MESLALLCLLLLMVVSRITPAANSYMRVSESCENISDTCFEDFTKALQYAKTTSDNFEIYISKGSYSLTDLFTFKGLQLRISKYEAEEEDIEISCIGENTGLAFIECTNVEISDLLFQNCGALHNSTTADYENGNVTEYVKFNAALFFAFCHNVKLTNNNILMSKGIAIQFYSVSGEVDIESNKFISNPYPSNNPNGGGLYIEFINCSQLVDFDLCKTNSDVQGVSKASYKIIGNNFANNSASDNFTGFSFDFPNSNNYISFGRGGGLSICFRGSSTHNTFDIESNTFTNNQAVYGGGMLLEFRNNASYNDIIVTNSTFKNNSAKDGGGGIRLSLFSSWTASDGQVLNNEVKFSNNNYTNNSAEYGGGVSIEVSKKRDSVIQHDLNSINFVDCIWQRNKARLGAGMDISRSYSRPKDTGVFPNINLTSCSFSYNSVNYNASILGYGALYTDSVPITFKDSITFSNNAGAGIVTVDNTVTFASGCNALFYNNKARDGAGITIFAFSTLIVHKNTTLNFTSNEATNEGGAIFAFRAGGRNLKSSRDCFLRYIDPTKHPHDWDTSITFVSNVANSGCNSIFTTSIDPCLWGDDKNITKLRQQALHWNNTFSYDPDCKTQVTTDPSFFNKINYTLKIHPGIRKKLGITAYNDQHQNVSEYLTLSAHTRDQNIVIDSRSKYISSDTILLWKKGTCSTSTSTNATNTSLILESDGPRVLIANVTIEFLPCPLGLVLQDTKTRVDNRTIDMCGCSCVNGNYYGLIHCVNSDDTAASILKGYWIGMTVTNESDSVKVGKCKYCQGQLYKNHSNSSLIKLENNFSATENMFCGAKRKGVLCGDCQDGYAPNFNSHGIECVKCKKAKAGAWLLFIFLRAIIPFTLFFLLFFLQFSVSSGYLNGPIFFAQMVSTVFPVLGPLNARFSSSSSQYLRKIFYTVYEIWDLDFCSSCFTTPCLHPNLSSTHILLIEYGIAFLPLLMVLFFKLMDLLKFYKEKPFIVVITCNFMRTRLFNLLTPKKAIRNALIAAVILTYNKVAVLTGYLLCPTPLYKKDAGSGNFLKNVHYVVYFNGSIDFMSKEHQKFAIPVMLISGVFLLVIPLILLLYRYEPIQTNDGFFNQLFKLIQEEFRSGSRDNPDNRIMQDPPFADIQQNPLFTPTDSVVPPPLEYNLNFTCCNNCLRYDDHIVATRRHKLWPPYCSFRVKVYHGSIRFNTAWGYNEWRWVPSLYFYARLCFILMYMFGESTMAIISLQAALSLLMAGFFLVFQPYIKHIHNNINGGIFLLMAMILSLESYQYDKTLSGLENYRFVVVIQDVLIMIPFVWITGYIVYKIYVACRKKKCGRRQRNNDAENRHLLTVAPGRTTANDDP